ncbi:unnamed protein product [Linum tenue]|uniref:Uncharacterized protein n=1 Tax=Linum tenue TaxID=586396 RepID=A0AAV0HXE3_9ROSI|nr:unnamed protein product [Linum tenue]
MKSFLKEQRLLASQNLCCLSRTKLHMCLKRKQEDVVGPETLSLQYSVLFQQPALMQSGLLPF